MKLRHEIKYQIISFQMAQLEARLNAIMERDNYDDGNGYYIRSLYFDDLVDSGFNDKEDGIFQREKFRIRIYNSNLDNMYLEKKRKFGAMINKERCEISKDILYAIMNDEFTLSFSNNKLLNNFILKQKTNMLRPKQIVDYDRKVYVCNAGNVRITLDKNLMAPITLDISDFNSPRIPAIENNISILEVKYDYALPNYIAQAIQMDIGKSSSSSKYYMCRLATLNTGRIIK